uniref:Uncharacterized protein n=1 Tax=Oryza glumipatula TaxID=40148 RepID=A0A0E0BN83_9ORYZ
MKGHHHHHSLPPSPPPKRRCTALAAAVPALVVCSILLPLVFLLGLHRPGHGSEERAAVVISTQAQASGWEDEAQATQGNAAC